MYEKLGELLNDRKLIDGTMPHRCEDWKDRKLQRYSEDVRKEYRRMADVIATAFEEYSVASVTTTDCANFLHDNFRTKHNTANKYANVLRKMFKFAISSKGLREDNRATSSICRTMRRSEARSFPRMLQLRRYGMPQ